ncbi:MAG: cell wall-active antibiotics response protein LiaF [Bacteroidota bacterium]|nr:cell wall-active antibiotics response protein LiaF [Bacteroidota bacterium]
MHNLFWGIILILFGIFFLLDNLGYADFSEIISSYWPLILVIWGISILIRKRPCVTALVISDPQQFTSDLLHQSNVFGDIFIKVTSQDFKGGSLSTVFGDCNIDLSGASLADGDHELRIHSVFGDSLIVLPKDAAVSITASSTFGDLTILGKHKGGFSPDLQSISLEYPTATKRLKLSISKVFGDVRVESA